MVAGEFVSVDPEAWKVVDGKLFLSFSKANRDEFQKNFTENKKKADEMWTKMSEQN